MGFLDDTLKNYIFVVKYYLCKEYIQNGCFYRIIFNYSKFHPASYLKKIYSPLANYVFKYIYILEYQTLRKRFLPFHSFNSISGKWLRNTAVTNRPTTYKRILFRKAVIRFLWEKITQFKTRVAG